MPPHSATVRGTLSNPKTQEAKQKHQEGKGNPTQLGDPGSLKAETSNSNPIPGRRNQDGAHDSVKSGSPHPSDPYERSPEDRVDSGQNSSDSQRPHSQKVRGTMSHPDAAYLMQAKKPLSMLGDHVSLKAEASNSSPTNQDRGAGTTDAEAMQNVADERVKA